MGTRARVSKVYYKKRKNRENMETRKIIKPFRKIYADTFEWVEEE